MSLAERIGEKRLPSNMPINMEIDDNSFSTCDKNKIKSVSSMSNGEIEQINSMAVFP